MKKKFDGYTIDVKKIKTTKIDNNTIEVVFDLSGNIEIGLEIDRLSWRSDFLYNLVWGNNPERQSWRTANIQNNFYMVDHIEHNKVVVRYCKR